MRDPIHTPSARLAAIVLFVALAPVAAPAASPTDDDGVVLTRAVSLREIAGRARLRIAYGPRVDVPVHCEDGSYGCTAERRFEQVVAIDFALEEREAGQGEIATSETPRGRILVGASLDDEGFDRFRAAVERRLRSLSAEAYRAPLAGTDRGEPFDAGTLARAGVPAWACMDDDASRMAWRLERVETERDDGGTAVTLGGTGIGGPAADALCDGLAAAADSAHADELRTLAVPTRLLFDEIRVVEANALPERAWRDEMVALPDGAWRVSRPDPGAAAGSEARWDDDTGEMTASVSRAEVRRVARVVRAHFPARTLDAPSWVQRWIARRYVRDLGPRPTRTPISEFEVLVAWLPLPPPAEEDRPPADRPLAPPAAADPPADGPFEIRSSSAAMLDEVAERLRDVGQPTPEALERAIVNEPAGLLSEGWAFVVCRPDGTAAWGLPPTPARADVLDPDPVCGEIDARVP